MSYLKSWHGVRIKMSESDFRPTKVKGRVMDNSILLAVAAYQDSKSALNTKSEVPLFYKKRLSNRMEIFDFDEELIINKMEEMMDLLDNAL